MANYETAYYDATMSDSESFEQWEDAGGLDTAERAHQRWNQMLRDYEAPAIDPGVDEALQEFVAKKKMSMEDAWY